MKILLPLLIKDGACNPKPRFRIDVHFVELFADVADSITNRLERRKITVGTVQTDIMLSV